MKKYSLLAFLFLFITSCDGDFLDRNPLDELSNEAFWTSEKDALAAATGCYDGWYSMDDVVYLDCVSDNAYGQFPWEGYQVQASGYATPTETGHSYMSYSRITRCNNFLANISRPQMDEKLRARLTAEVRFMRAWEYYIKVLFYGGVPLVKDVLTLENSNLPRNSKEEVVDFILSELNEIYDQLPESYGGDDQGRVTKGAALTLKARVEIFTGKYNECAASCAKVMDLGYELFPSYKGLFKIANKGNKEVIMDVQYIQNLYPNWVLGVMPPNSVGGWSSIDPTQALIDSYECADGYTIDESPLYDEDNPYVNRDPRFAASIIYPGVLYNGSYFNPIDASDPNGDYYVPLGRSKTGYHPRKYIDDLSDYSDMWNTGMNAIVMRYAEVLLMYAESKIEMNQIDESVYDAINAVRDRAGMPNVDRNRYNSQDKMREFIRRERRVELAMEGLRWFDVCRWKIGEQVMNGPVVGSRLGTVDPKTGELHLTDDRIQVEIRTFDPAKHYLWPIPQYIIDSTPAIEQNPGY